MKRPLCLLALSLAAAVPAAAQQPARAEVLVLGVYHMNNPGHDIFNTQADDVLAPKRQAEIAQVVETLKKFNPTKIAVERDIYDRNFAKRYDDYLAGKYELTRNEIDQLGLRLAKELGLKTVHAVDVDGDFPWMRFVNYAKGSGRTKEVDALTGEIGAMVKAQNAYLASHTILETLLYMNADEKVAQDVGFYYRQAEFGEPGDWAGADLLADWFRRNIRIYANVMRIIEAPTDRVLVIYGAGHLGWLRDDFAGNPGVRLRKLGEFAK